MSHSPKDPERVAESTARHLLERATALEADGPTLAQLRQAAVEAGISPAAFDAAVVEWRAASRTTESVVHGGLAARLVRETAALAIGGLTAAALALAQGMLDAPWLVHKLTDPIGLAFGAIIAARLRARTASLVLGGLAVSQGAEFLMDAAAGAPAIHGLGAHLALMMAGVGGVAVGRALWGRPTQSTLETLPPLDPDGADAPSSDAGSRVVGPDGVEADRRFLEMLRTRRRWPASRSTLRAPLSVCPDGMLKRAGR